MEILDSVYTRLAPGLPTGIALIATILILIAVRYILNKSYAGALELRFRRQIVTMILSFIGVLAIIIVLPINDTLRGQLLTLFGILISAAIALSSTTLLGNAMAGMMLRAVRNFKPGDFVSVGEHFGRVSDRGLFHVEIQTEDRDLTTIPNLYLVTNPVTVSRASGTIISATVSLGYDVSHSKIETVLLEAAEGAGLQDPFVHILELGDFSVTYRVAGLLKEVKQLLSTRSNLKEMMLDKLHLAGIEIVSPTFMNTRAMPEHRVFIPVVEREHAAVEPASVKTPEAVVFDKAEKAESLANLREMHEQFGKDIEAMKEKVEESKNGESQRDNLKAELERLELRRSRLADIIKIREEIEKE
ncbi:MAG: mechanosensitive ion channel domain-containing protein [Candidatus Zixiibacteriota bacterium]